MRKLLLKLSRVEQPRHCRVSNWTLIKSILGFGKTIRKSTLSPWVDGWHGTSLFHSRAFELMKNGPYNIGGMMMKDYYDACDQLGLDRFKH